MRWQFHCSFWPCTCIKKAAFHCCLLRWLAWQPAISLPARTLIRLLKKIKSAFAFRAVGVVLAIQLSFLMVDLLSIEPSLRNGLISVFLHLNGFIGSMLAFMLVLLVHYFAIQWAFGYGVSLAKRGR